jgi:phosphatidylserine/phosphatidylglycerophosphate/cardiolipin synthase-like enzyme
MSDKRLRLFAVLVLAAGLGACASVTIKPEDCPAGTQKLEGCPPLGAIDDAQIAELHADRTWTSSKELEEDPIEYGRDAKVPVNRAQAKFIGSTDEDGLISLAAKLHMIEQAEHTLDLMYYIYRDDIVGLAILGALCDAVERGVDVRIMVDSLGSVSLDKKFLKALESCAINAGFVRNADGELTIYKARVQPVIFNAASRIFVNHNRRSHDKLLVKDGYFPEKSAVMTGGRNISLAYYGILPDGSSNPDTYRDAELFLRGGNVESEEDYGVGAVSEIYYTLLFLFKNNSRLRMTTMTNPDTAYRKEREQMRQSLEELTALPRLKEQLDRMPYYFSAEFHEARVRLAHELANLTDKNVVNDAVINAEHNPNSIMTILNSIDDDEFDSMQIISPYLFAAQYKDKDKNIVLDEARNMLQWLDDNPGRTLDIVTNSALTSDNFFAQAVIDMDLAPRLLLSEELQEAWLRKPTESELNPDLVESAEWIAMVNHPRLRIYETGTLDDVIFGGDVEHGKQHAKYVVSDDFGFVGTTNFDYRSRLYNNEMGFFFESQSLADEIRENTDYMIKSSYRWGSPEWLEMRKRLMEQKGLKASMTRKQRGTYKTLKATGLQWFF